MRTTAAGRSPAAGATRCKASRGTGLDCEVERLVALHDWNRRNARASAWNVLKVILLCRPLGGAFRANIETTGIGWFTADTLPPLATEKNTPEQIALCFAAHADPNWRPPID